MRNLPWAVGFVVLWSSGFVGAVLAGESSTSGVLAWRYIVTAALLLVLAGTSRRPRPSVREVGRQGVLGFLAHVVFLGGVFAAADAKVDAGTTALVCAAQPMLVAAAGRLWWGDHLGLIRLCGLGLGVVAVAITVGGGGTWSTASLLPVVSVIGLSAAALLQRRWPSETDVLQALAVQAAVAALAFAGFAAASGTLATPVTVDFIGALAWLVTLSGIGGYACFLVCLQRLGASTTSTLLYLTPPVTTLWGWAMFAESPTSAQLIGLGLGALAVVLTLAPQPQHKGVRTDRTAASR